MSTGWLASLASPLFWLGVAVLMAHELDAVRAQEWRLLYVLRRMPEKRARDAFIVIHVPVVAGLLWLFGHSMSQIGAPSQIAFDAFLVVHAGLHWRLQNHPLNDFQGWISRGLIYGAAVVGALHMLIVSISVCGLRPGRVVPCRDGDRSNSGYRPPLGVVSIPQIRIAVWPPPGVEAPPPSPWAAGCLGAGSRRRVDKAPWKPAGVLTGAPADLPAPVAVTRRLLLHEVRRAARQRPAHRGAPALTSTIRDFATQERSELADR